MSPIGAALPWEAASVEAVGRGVVSEVCAITGDAATAIATIHAVREENVPANQFMSFLLSGATGAPYVPFRER
jgi:hypothetical protein